MTPPSALSLMAPMSAHFLDALFLPMLVVMPDLSATLPPARWGR